MRSSLAVVVACGMLMSLAQHDHTRSHVHRTHPHHLVKKDVVVEVVDIIVVDCLLDGRVIGPEECENGIRNGTLKFVGDGNQNPPQPTTFTTFLVSSTQSMALQTIPSTDSTQTSVPSTDTMTKPTPVQDISAGTLATLASSVQVSNTDHGTGDWPSNSAFANIDKTFPDGQLDCNHFPSEYGAMPLDWLNIGGWASVQKPQQDRAAGYDDIMTLTPNECPDGNCCVEGSFCSYGCPVGYLKYQWPVKQGATGQSIGGLYCQNGKLHLTNPNVKTLCAQGSDNVKVTVKNKLSQNVAICRTNYPGDEKMSIPVNVNPGETKQLACPDSANYYTWENKGTSAQYYINMPGYSVEKACVWGDYGDDFGNWAPGNLGVGWSNGRAWLSIAANHPTQMTVTLPYTIELVGGNTKCRYRDGQYCGGDNYENCSSEGCTVSAPGGEVTYILS